VDLLLDLCGMVSSQQKKDIFERLMQRETISGTDPEAFKLRDASFATKKLLVQMNNSSDAAEIRNLLSQSQVPKFTKALLYLHRCISTMVRTPKSAETSLSISIVYSLISEELPLKMVY